MPKLPKISKSFKMKARSEMEGGRHAPSNPKNVVNTSKLPSKQQYVLGERIVSSMEVVQGENALVI